MMQAGVVIRGGLLLFSIVLWACGEKDGKLAANGAAALSEDPEARQALQGIWTDRETETVLFCIRGDTVYYPDTLSVPVRFFVWRDTFYLVGTDTTSYPISQIGRKAFSFHTSTGDAVRLVRSENPDDTLYFTRREPVTLTYSEVVKKDTVVYHNGERYHCYVYVNPSKQKVYKTGYTDEGIAVENVYYDNIIHICVYKGRECLFSRDYSKRDFAGIVPDNILEQAILSNMVAGKADSRGCHFQATVGIPDDAGCYMVDIRVDYDGHPQMALMEY